MNSTSSVLIALLLAACSSATAQSIQPVQFDPRAKPLAITQTGPFVQLADGGLLCVKDNSALISADDGLTWTSHPIFGERKLSARPEQALIRTRDGTIVLILMDDLDKQWKWNAKTQSTDGDVRLRVWGVRSRDEGKTWTDLQMIQDGYCGAIRDIIETKNGDLVVPIQRFLTKESRHATMPYVSTDQGKSWNPTTLLDVGGRGDHDGAIEATLTQLKDDRLWMLLRTNYDYFWQAYSSDNGMTWDGFGPTGIDASSSPGLVKRLASGRLCLIWNRLYREGETSITRRSGQVSASAASWQREELSVALSDDDGKTWSRAVVIARQLGARLSYPYLLERHPGELWITTMQGGLKIDVKEADLLSNEPAVRNQASATTTQKRIRIVALGDSITKGARPAIGKAPAVSVEETFVARVQAALSKDGIDAEVVNAGVSGNRTDQALSRLQKDVLALSPTYVTIMFGTNDSCYDEGKTSPRLRRPTTTPTSAG